MIYDFAHWSATHFNLSNLFYSCKTNCMLHPFNVRNAIYVCNPFYVLNAFYVRNAFYRRNAFYARNTF